MGSTAPSVAGFRNLLECQLVASGPVSASPSPTTHAHNQVGIVERRAKSVHQRIAEFAAFVDRPRRLRRHVAGYPVGPTELPEQPLDSVAVLLDVGIDLGVGTFQVGVGHQPRTAMSRPDDVNHVQIALADQPVPVQVKKVQPRRRSPVAQQPRLHVVQRQGPLQQRIVLQVNLADGEIIGGAPVGVHPLQFIVGQRTLTVSRGRVYRSSMAHECTSHRGEVYVIFRLAARRSFLA